jgi:hypothetical protein
VGSAWTATELPNIRPYKITVVPEMKPAEYGKRVRFGNWFIDRVQDVHPDPKLTFCTDKANSNLSEYLNSRVQYPVARVSIGFINVTTVRNYFLLLYY